jgi:hypothetical protein
MGTEKTDFGSTHRDPPADRVLTCRYHEYLGSVFGGMSKNVTSIWEGGPNDFIEEMLKKYGSCPQRL